MFGVGFPEFVAIFLVVLLLFGPKALPEIMRGLAQVVKLFRKELRDLKETMELDSPQKLTSSDENNFKPRWDISNDFNPESSRRDWRPKGTENFEKGGK